MAKLILRAPDCAETEISLDDKDSVTIGRSPECDMPITDGQASRRHASVVRLSEGYEVSDLGSTNGTLLNDVQIKKRHLQNGDIIKIGATEIVYDDPDAVPVAGDESGACALVYAKGGRKGQKIELTAQRSTLGRKESNTVVLQDTVASSYHCEVVRDLNGYTLRDLGSTNGTLVNNEMVTETQLVHGARIRIGNTRFVFQDPAMAEIDLELAGVDDDEVEWGMMRDLDLASVRKRNPATIVYAILLIGLGGAMWWLTQNPPTRPVIGADDGPNGNKIVPYGFPRASSALAWEGDEDGGADVSWVKAGGGSLSVRGGFALYSEEFAASGRSFKLLGKLSGDGQLGLFFHGGDLTQWVLAPAGSAADLTCSAPPWASRMQVGVRVEPGKTARIDDVALIPAGPARIDLVEQGNFQLRIVDGRQVEVAYVGAPMLARGLLVARDAGGGTVASGALKVSASKEGDNFIEVTVQGGEAAQVGIEFTEVNGFLTQGGWRAFTPGQQPEFHPSFAESGALKLDGVRKLLVGDRGRAFSCIPVGDDARLTTIATVDPNGSRWAILGAPGESGFSFRIKTNLRQEGVLAESAVATALQLHSDRQWGEFIVAAQSALAEFPFMSNSSKS
ncbi:MAG: FHA domain-containing protein, partial [Planctomycetota bacterium]